MIVRPTLRIHQQLSADGVSGNASQMACVVGPAARLHRYADLLEKPLISLGGYDPSANDTHEWPDRAPGGIPDLDSLKIFVDNGLALYHTDAVGDTSGGRGTVVPVAGYKNRIKSSTLGYTSNGPSNPHSALFGTRGVRVGDRVQLKGEGVDCAEAVCWSEVVGFAGEVTAASVGVAVADSGNHAAVTAALSVTQSAGTENCVVAATSGAYSGIASGVLDETYTVIVTRAPTANCSKAQVRIVSGSGTDNVLELDVELDEAIDIGTRGVKLTWSIDDDVACEDSEDTFVVGQTWAVVAKQTFNAACGTSAGTYTGVNNDTYIVRCTRGGLFASGDKPQISVSTVLGEDFSGPTDVTAASSAVAIGSKGVTIAFGACGGGSAPTGLRFGDSWRVTVTASGQGRMSTLILKDDIPTAMLSALDLELNLYIPLENGTELPKQRPQSAPTVNFSANNDEITINASARVFHDDWVVSGVKQSLPLSSGDLYAQYREWNLKNKNKLVRITGLSDIADQIGGDLVPENPLAYAVAKALLNSNATAVYAVATGTPAAQDYPDALATIEGVSEIYNIVPLSYDEAVANMVMSLVASESAPGVNRHKAMFVGLTAPTLRMIVGKSSASDNLIRPTSVDGAVVLATVDDNPQVTGTQYTRVTAGSNAGFITHGVKPGDVVRFQFSVDGFGNPSYLSLPVDRVLSENTLILASPLTAAVAVAQKLEVWRNLSASDVVDDLVQQAQAFSNRRVCAVLADGIVSDGAVVPNYFLGAALAGMRSGMAPHQPMTNVGISGFSGIARTWRFSQTQLDTLMNAGIWVVSSNQQGSIYSINALTTDISSLNHRTESIRSNLDNISATIRDMWTPLIGRSNVSPELLRKLRHDLENQLERLSTNYSTDTIGPQIILSAEETAGDLITMLRQHPTFRDRVEVQVRTPLPAPWNEGDVYLLVG